METKELADKIVELLKKEPQGYEIALMEELVNWFNNHPEVKRQQLKINQLGPFTWNLQIISLPSEKSTDSEPADTAT
jgi:hypothetical protein